jgi:hypothetical protein
MNDALAEEVKKLLKHLEVGIFNHIIISGSKEKLNDLYDLLWQECQSLNMKASQFEVTIDSIHSIPNLDYTGLMFIKGLEYLKPKQNATYALRSRLDVGQFQGLKSYIFCEQSAFHNHFYDSEAPFYLFCQQYETS